MPYKKQKAIRSNKKNVIYDLMTDLGLYLYVWNNLQKLTNHVPTTPFRPMCHCVSAETEQRTGRIAFAFRPMQQELVNLQCSDDNRLCENLIAEYVIAALRK